MRELSKLIIQTDTLDTVKIELPDIDMVPDVPTYSGERYILDLSKLTTHEDILKVLKHYSTRVVLDVLEISGIEEYVKPYDNRKTH